MHRRATASRIPRSAVAHIIVLCLFGVSLSAIAAADRAKPMGATPSPPATESHPTQEDCETGCTGALIRCIQYTNVGRDRCDAKAEKTYERCLKGIKKPGSGVQSVAFHCDSGLPSNLDSDADQSR